MFCQSERSGEDILKSRELLEQTETFQKVKRTICNSDVSTIMIDVVWGYGREHVMRLVHNEAAVLIRLEENIVSFNYFLEWLINEFQRFQIEIKGIPLLKKECKMTSLIQDYMASEIADQIVNSMGGAGILAVDGIHHMKSFRVLDFARRLLNILSKRIKILLCTNRPIEEHIERQLSFLGTHRIRTKDMCLTKKDLEFLVGKRMETWNETERREWIQLLWTYFGGWPLGITYALDFLYGEGSRVPVESVCCVSSHPIYGSYGRYCLREYLPPDVADFLKKICRFPKITGPICNQTLNILWAKDYLEYLMEKGILEPSEREDSYWIPGVVKESLSGCQKEPNQRQREVMQEKETQKERVRIFCFGALRLLYRGREPAWRTRKTRELFALLFTGQGAAVTKDAIVGYLWPEYGEEKACQLFYTTMSYLKKNLEEIGLRDMIRSVRKQYSLNLELVESDYQQLQDMKCAADQGQWDEIQRMPDIREIYQGSFLEFCSEEWCYGTRTYMERICIQCCRQIGSYEMGRQNFQKAAEYLEFSYHLDPFSEFGITSLMACYGSLGDYHSVKRIYKETKDTYRRELGIEPGKNVEKAYYQCIAG